MLQCPKEYFVPVIKETKLFDVHRVELTHVANCTPQDGRVAGPKYAHNCCYRTKPLQKRTPAQQADMPP
jgi:hypothetical protein